MVLERAHDKISCRKKFENLGEGPVIVAKPSLFPEAHLAKILGG